MMASFVQAKLEENWDAKLESFDPSPSDLHYSDPVVYSEMLKNVGTLERKNYLRTWYMLYVMLFKSMVVHIGQIKTIHL